MTACVLKVEILAEVVAYLDRNELERISIVSRLLNGIVKEYFRVTPYRFLRHLYIRPDLRNYEMRLWWMESGKLRNKEGSFREIVPIIGKGHFRARRVLLCYANYIGVEHLRNLAFLWSNEHLVLQVHMLAEGHGTQVLDRLLSHDRILLCSTLELDLQNYGHVGWRVWPLPLCAYPKLYICSTLALQVHQAAAENLIKYLYGIPAQRRGKVVLKVNVMPKEVEHLNNFLDKLVEYFLKATHPSPFQARIHQHPSEALDISFQLKNTETGEQLSLSPPTNGIHILQCHFVKL